MIVETIGFEDSSDALLRVALPVESKVLLYGLRRIERLVHLRVVSDRDRLRYHEISLEDFKLRSFLALELLSFREKREILLLSLLCMQESTLLSFRMK